MKAPDKIYIPVEADGLSERTELQFDHASPYRNMFAWDNIEYIRKDALLEWARGQYDKSMSFVTGDLKLDYKIQLLWLTIVKYIEKL